MMRIRPAQMKIFENSALRRFEDEMVIHSREFSPRLCEVLGEEQLRVALRQAISRGGGHGFTLRGPLRLSIEMMFLFGSDFDNDPQYPMAARILAAPNDQMKRAEALHEEVLVYLEKVAGPDNVNVRDALNGLSAMAQRPVNFTSHNFAREIRQEMTRIFPRKAAYVGEEGLNSLIREGREEAGRHRFPLRGEAMLVTLMFAFGHGCFKDPLYPWIERTLKDEKIVNPEARAERLEKKAMTWLDHVLSRPGIDVV